MQFRSPGNPVREDLDHLYLAYLARNLHTAVFNTLTEELKPLDIAPVQMAIIYRCYTGDARNLSDLSQIIPVDSPSLSRNVNHLVDKGLLEREYSKSDRRVIVLHLTEQAQNIMSDIIWHRQAYEAKLLAGVSEQEKADLVAIVEKILANAAV